MVAFGLILIAIVLAGLGWVAMQTIYIIRDELGPMLEHEFLLRRMEMRLMIDEAGYECPDWLRDTAYEEDKGKVVRLVPKPKQE